MTDSQFRVVCECGGRIAIKREDLSLQPAADAADFGIAVCTLTVGRCAACDRRIKQEAASAERTAVYRGLSSC